MQSIADYELIRSLGWGNHGQFFLARKPSRLPVDAEFVAVKVFAGTTTADIFRRATRELKAFAAVASPYIVSLYDAGQHDSVLYYSMEYIAGGSLANPSQPLSRDDAIKAVRDAAIAAATLHAAGLVHRDIKPGNIMLPEHGGKLSDLGLAHVVAPGVTVTGMGPAASLEYTDPALLLGGRAMPATDVYSLGVTLHRAITGQCIFGEDLPPDDGLLALRRVMSAEVQLSPGLPPAAADLIADCTGPEADRPSRGHQPRYRDVGQGCVQPDLHHGTGRPERNRYKFSGLTSDIPVRDGHSGLHRHRSHHRRPGRGRYVPVGTVERQRDCPCYRQRRSGADSRRHRPVDPVGQPLRRHRHSRHHCARRGQHADLTRPLLHREPRDRHQHQPRLTELRRRNRHRRLRRHDHHGRNEPGHSELVNIAELQPVAWHG